MWEKGNLRRIYMNDEGYNTKKMSTKVFLWEDENGSIQVSCRIDCPSQGWEWIASQKKAIIEEVEHRIAPLLAEIDGVELPAAEVDTEALAAAASQAVEFVTPTDGLSRRGAIYIDIQGWPHRRRRHGRDSRLQAAAVPGGGMAHGHLRCHPWATWRRVDGCRSRRQRYEVLPEWPRGRCEVPRVLRTCGGRRKASQHRDSSRLRIDLPCPGRPGRAFFLTINDWT